MQTFGNTIRNLTNMFIDSIGICLCLVGCICLFIIHYMGLSYGIGLAGMDTQPIYVEPMIGSLVKFILPKANYTHGLGMVVAFTLMVGTFICFHEAYDILGLFFDRRQYQLQNDATSVSLVDQKVLKNSITLLLFGIPTVAVFLWDINLFEYRLIAGASGIYTPDQANGILNKAQQMSNNGDLWVWASLHIGARGYVSLVVIASFSLEYAMGKFSENFTNLLINMNLLVNGEPDKEKRMDFYGYDAEGNPIYEPNQPISYDTAGNPIHQESEAHQQMKEDASEQKNSTASSASGKRGEDDPLFSTGARSESASDSSQAHETCGEEERRNTSPENDVIGSPTAERVTFDHAKANPARYWVDPDNNQIWDVDYRNELFSQSHKQNV